MAESSISVCVRIRPFSEKEAALLAPEDNVLPFLGDGGLGASPNKPNIPMAGTGPGGLRPRIIRPIVKPMDDQVLVFDPPDNNPLSRLYSHSHLKHGGKKSKDMRYAFDRVFNSSCTQNDVFEQTCKPLMDGILNGYNASVFAYGATGCGKTHTISGSPDDPGLIFLTMKELYQRIDEAREESEVYIRLSYLEIYNETIRDLLSAEPTPPGQGLALREDAHNKISVVGITELVPESPESVLQIIQEGNLRRTMSPTEANAVSSRSHAVLQINVTQKPRTADMSEDVTSASLNIIDLAGSERASATRNNGARMKEGANINKSLLALGNCINALCQSGGLRKHVPYRNSKLTRLLKFSLGGNCKTVMIVCVSPSSAHYEETHNALKYANQAKNIRTKVSRNMINVDRHVAQYVQTIQQLKEEVAELKAKLEEKGSHESAAEKRKKAEAAQEAESVKREIRGKTDNVRRLVREKGGFEAQVTAAETRAAEIRRRLDQVEAELAAHRSRRGPSPTNEGDTELELLEGERDILRSLLQRDEAIVRSQELKAGSDSLSNSLTMHRGLLMVASQNQKFDKHTSETIQYLGDSVRAELESVKAQVKYEAVLAVLRNSAQDVARLVSIAAKSTVALRDAAGQLEYETGEVSKGVDVTELASKLSELAAQMRGLATGNDQEFVSLAGSGVLQSPQAGSSARPARIGTSTVLRRARRSFGNAQPAPVLQVAPAAVGVRAASAAGPTRPAGTARTGVRRTSLAIGSSRGIPSSPSKPPGAKGALAAAAAAAPARAHFASSPRKANRRLSLRRVSAVGLGSKPSAAAESAAPAKKTFRWADEAGEGSIDDKGKKAAPREALAAPSSTVAAATAPLAGINGSTSQAQPQHALIRKPASRIPGDHDTGDSSNGTDWEDYGSEASQNRAGARASPNAALTAIAKPVAKKAASMFDRNFLAKRAAVNSASSPSGLSGARRAGGDELENDDRCAATGSSSFSIDQFAAREPLGEMGNRSLPTNVTALELTGAKFGSERRGPYSRQSLSGTGGGGVGPVRRKARTSSILPSGPGALASIPASPKAPRVASGPPNNTAARLARRASSLTVNMSAPTPGNPLGRPSSIVPSSRSAALGTIGENSFDAKMGKRMLR
ncbi:tubulin-dependent ATPase kip3 [Thecaphora frezii]